MTIILKTKRDIMLDSMDSLCTNSVPIDRRQFKVIVPSNFRQIVQISLVPFYRRFYVV